MASDKPEHEQKTRRAIRGLRTRDLHRQRWLVRVATPLFLLYACWIVGSWSYRIRDASWYWESPWMWVDLFVVVSCSLGMVYTAYHLARLNSKPDYCRRVWRRLRREYPNECPWCGYDVRGCPTSVCSECGKPIDPPKEEDAPGSA